ncbi:MAG: glycosyltransferase family 1 protein [Patescibacteria group bacterium]
MIIGIDASRANRDHKSGTEWYSYYLIRWLAKLDNKNQYILYTDKPLKGGLLDLTTKQYSLKNEVDSGIKYDNKGFQILKSPFNNFKAKVLKWPFYFFWTLGRMSWEMLIHRPDILFIPAHTLPLFHPKKTIMTIHDIAFERDRYLYRQDYMGPEGKSFRKVIGFFVRIFTLGKYSANTIDYLSWSTRYGLKHAKKIITVSNFSKQEMLDIYGAKDEKIKVVYNGYNKYLYRKIEDKKQIVNVLDKYGIKQPYILYVGRIEKKKNTPFLIEAFAIAEEKLRDKNLKLVLVGDASFGYDEVKYVIQEFNIANKVIMPGWIDEEDIPYIYNGAEAFIFPTKFEGFGIPVLQAMACRVPIIASDIPVLREVAGQAASYFNPYDIKSMAEAIEEIIQNKNLRQMLVEKGKDKIKKYNWEKTAEQTLKEIIDL